MNHVLFKSEITQLLLIFNIVPPGFGGVMYKIREFNTPGYKVQDPYFCRLYLSARHIGNGCLFSSVFGCPFEHRGVSDGSFVFSLMCMERMGKVKGWNNSQPAHFIISCTVWLTNEREKMVAEKAVNSAVGPSLRRIQHSEESVKAEKF